jgi:hypothetical protein
LKYLSSTRYAPHLRTFLDVGFRVIVPDMPSVSTELAYERLSTNLFASFPVRPLDGVSDAFNGIFLRFLSMYDPHSIHAHLPDPHLLTSAVYAVLQDVVRVDVNNGKRQREVFLNGA